MFNGLLVGTSVRMLRAELIVRQVDRRNASARIFVWSQTRMMGFCSQGQASSFYSVDAGGRNVGRYKGSMELSLCTRPAGRVLVIYPELV
jgi:hypothetical protein